VHPGLLARNCVAWAWLGRGFDVRLGLRLYFFVAYRRIIGGRHRHFALPIDIFQ
jgi:hypothetical protein